MLHYRCDLSYRQLKAQFDIASKFFENRRQKIEEIIAKYNSYKRILQMVVRSLSLYSKFADADLLFLCRVS